MSLTEAMIWTAAGGVTLRILGVRWAVWLTLPAVVGFVAWPLLRHFVPLLPLWTALILILLVPIVGAILTIRAGQAILTGLFGNDTAAHVVAHWLISLFGGLGRGRRRRIPDPLLPRPGTAHFHPSDIGGGHDRP